MRASHIHVLSSLLVLFSLVSFRYYGLTMHAKLALEEVVYECLVR